MFGQLKVGGGLFVLLYSSSMVWTALLSHFVLRRPLTYQQWTAVLEVTLGLALSNVGLLLFDRGSSSGSAWEHLVGSFVLLSGALAAAAYFVSCEWILNGGADRSAPVCSVPLRRSRAWGYFSFPQGGGSPPAPAPPPPPPGPPPLQTKGTIAGKNEFTIRKSGNLGRFWYTDPPLPPPSPVKPSRGRSSSPRQCSAMDVTASQARRPLQAPTAIRRRFARLVRCGMAFEAAVRRGVWSAALLAAGVAVLRSMTVGREGAPSKSDTGSTAELVLNPPQKICTPPNTIPPPKYYTPFGIMGVLPKSVPPWHIQAKEQMQGTPSTPLQSHSLEESSDRGLLLDVGNAAGGMGHGCRRCCPSSISTCDTHIHKSLIRIKFVVWQRAEAGHLMRNPQHQMLYPANTISPWPY